MGNKTLNINGLQVRGDTAANWTSKNPTLKAREFAIETDTKKIKLGDGATAWNSLEYWGAANWDKIVGKPTIPTKVSELTNDSNFTTASGHTHGFLQNPGSLDTQEKIDGFIEANKLKFATFKTTEANNVAMLSNDGMLLSIPWTSTNYGVQLAFDDVKSGDIIKVRGKSSTWGDWFSILHSGNVSSFALTSASTLNAAKLSGTIPASCYTDTKNTTGSTDTSSKIFLVGATSQAANPQTYSDNEVHVTNGRLQAKEVSVNGGALLQYNSAAGCLEITF